jgi:hypothetical protein
MNNQELIDSFFVKDGQNLPSGSSRRSVLLALGKDLEFCILLPKVWTSETQSKVKLNPQQYSALQEILPSFTVISLFCTAVDVLARVIKKNAIPTNGETNRDYFKDCAEKWFKLSREEAKELWLLRNGISHGYKLTGKRHAARQFGHGRIMKQRESDKVWEFYLHAMYSTFTKTKRDLYEHINSLQDNEKDEIGKYLEKHGFFYTKA